MPARHPERPQSDHRNTGRELDPVADEARRILRAAMVRRSVSFKALADALNARGDGPPESVQSLINKVNRGRFSFAFVIRACRAMGMNGVDFGDLETDAGAPDA